MIPGIEKFKEYFIKHNTDYVIIGGLATVFALRDYGYLARATKDVDIVVISHENEEFLKQLLKFIQDGEYETKERTDNPDRHNLYRFKNSPYDEFPKQIEIFATHAEDSEIVTDHHIIPIETPEYYDCISAILLDENYFNLLKENTEINDGLRLATAEVLIPLKIHAHINLIENSNGQYNNKHLEDVIRLLPFLDPDYNSVDLKAQPASDYEKFLPLF